MDEATKLWRVDCSYYSRNVSVYPLVAKNECKFRGVGVASLPKFPVFSADVQNIVAYVQNIVAYVQNIVGYVHNIVGVQNIVGLCAKYSFDGYYTNLIDRPQFHLLLKHQKVKKWCFIVSVDSISRDERGFPLTQYITNGRISRARYTITHFKHHHRVLQLISNRMSV